MLCTVPKGQELFEKVLDNGREFLDTSLAVWMATDLSAYLGVVCML